MARSVTQNPANKVGRNSGGGPAGVSEVVPTQAEAERGLRPVRVDEPRGGWGRLLGAGLGALAAAGAGAAAWRARRAREQRTLRGRLRRLLSWR